MLQILEDFRAYIIVTNAYNVNYHIQYHPESIEKFFSTRVRQIYVTTSMMSPHNDNDNAGDDDEMHLSFFCLIIIVQLCERTRAENG